LAESCRESLK